MRQLFARCCMLLLISGITGIHLLDAQVSRKTDDETSKQESAFQGMSNAVAAVPLSGPVDPDAYIVGPGDIFSLNMWLASPVVIQVPVTPEGSIIIPTVGEVSVSGLKLKEAKENALRAIRKKYVSGNITFTLIAPRTFTVTVRGAVRRTGTFFVQASQRVDQVIAQANRVTEIESKYLQQDNQYLDGINARLGIEKRSSERNIVVQHRDGTTQRVDVAAYYALGRPELNPYLRDGDIVIVNQQNLRTDFVAVYGAVSKEGVVEYVEGDSVMTALYLAQGLTPLGDSSQVELTSFSSEEGNTSSQMLDLRNRNQANRQLHRGDRLMVRNRQLPALNYKVFVDGEVKNRGFYPISKDSTTLFDIVQRAGGLTEFASLDRSQLYRRSVSSLDIVSERLESARGGVTTEDSAYFYLETSIRLNRELVIVDFPGLIGRHERSKDIFLKDGDEIVIGSASKTIYVFGQVINPGHVPFVKGKDAQYYVTSAGGFTEYARSGDMRIIKARTKQWLAPVETVIEEGDYVWVPKEPYRPFGYYLQLYGQVFGIVGTVATLYILVTK